MGSSSSTPIHASNSLSVNSSYVTIWSVGMNHDPLERARRAIHDAEASLATAPQQRTELIEVVRTLADALAAVERRLAAQQAMLDDRLLRVENNRVFRLWNRLTALTGAAARRAREHERLSEASYSIWVAHEHSTLPTREQARAAADEWTRPKISAVIAPRNPALLAITLNSLHSQVNANWEVCLALAPGDESWATGFEHLGDRVRRCATPASSSAASRLNSAAQLATGEYLCFPDEGDTLSPYAFYYLGAALQSAAHDLLYSDEDHLANAVRSRPIFKPHWSPDLLASCMYMGQLLAIRREIFLGLDGFRPAHDAAHLHDLALRATSTGVHPEHIPRILYHAAGDAVPSDPPSADAGTKAAPLRLTAVICSRSAALIRGCLEALRATAGDAVARIIVVLHEENGPNAALREAVREAGADSVPFTGAFNFAVMNNTAASLVETPGILFLNDDVVGRENGWAARLAGEVAREVTGIAGAVLRYPSGDLQHAGIVTGIGDGAGHIGRHMRSSPLWPWLEMRRNVSAVTGACLAMRTGLFRDLGGFDPGFPNNYNDVDLCLRVRERGYQIVCVPVPGLIHAECQTREGIVHFAERYRFYQKWTHVLCRPDPYYSEALAPTETIALNLTGDCGFRSVLGG